MKTVIVALVALLAASVAASPVEEHHHDFGFGAGALMERAQGKKRPSKHSHKVQDFRKNCDCPPANCPAGLITDKKSLCQCQNSHSQACFLKSNGGCPAPSKKAC